MGNGLRFEARAATISGTIICLMYLVTGFRTRTAGRAEAPDLDWAVNDLRAPKTNTGCRLKIAALQQLESPAQASPSQSSTSRVTVSSSRSSGRRLIARK